ncbi:MAG: anhydro-N-acetylmuramic acid kinase, partial [Acidobacteriaceae bacterium]|nr:anhydro-N-acetylmuramic acid kinase [Acidobacteriaceae bacterium]
AFDTGPGNMVMDGLMGEDEYDRDGATASRGVVNDTLLAELLAHPYYRQPPPKTAGREQYGREFLGRFAHLSREDAVATAAELTARTIAQAVAAYPGTQEVIASGGGVKNPYLMDRLRQALTADLKTSQDFGVDPDAKEAIAFAILAYESFHGRPGNVPSATGAARAVILGKSVDP